MKAIGRSALLGCSTVALLAGMTAGCAVAQAPASQSVSKAAQSDTAVLASLEQQIENAIVHQDTVFLSSIFVPTFQWTHNGNNRETRAHFLSSVHREPPPVSVGRTVSRTVDSIMVEVHDDVALTTGRIHVTRTGGTIFQDFTIRYVRVYQRRSRSEPWHLVTHRAIALTQGPPPTGGP